MMSHVDPMQQEKKSNMQKNMLLLILHHLSYWAHPHELVQAW
jgi:hypothetical protein